MMTDTDGSDHVGRLMALRRREMPDVPLDGMAILGRARRLDQLSRKWIEAVFEHYDLDSGEFDVLATLQRGGPPYEMRPTEIFQALLITSGGLTDRLNRLEKKGLVERTASNDRRSVPVRLSEYGLDTIRRAYAHDMDVERELLTGLTEQERSELARLLAKLLSAIETSAI
jgi:DNA-binding MarR family transcriptional regulator